jgi:acetylornithine deacetylase/succinyl-diaminopimelate desuccinylase-like protein
MLRDVLTDAGFACETLAERPDRPNILATLRGAHPGPRFCLHGHVDTVGANPSEWRFDPWSGKTADGCVWGRGALDMKGQVAASVAAAAELASAGWRPQHGELAVLTTVDEETGSSAGVGWLVSENPGKIRTDYLITEGAGEVVTIAGRSLLTVAVAEKTALRYRITTHGRSGHSSMPGLGDNALERLAPLIVRLCRPLPDASDSPELGRLLRMLDGGAADAATPDWRDTEPVLRAMLDAMAKTTLSPTRVAASEAINVIPGTAHVDVDCRTVPGIPEPEARAQIAGLLGEDGYELSLLGSLAGNRSPVDGPLMRAIQSWCDRHASVLRVAPILLPGATDAHWFRSTFPDVVAYGVFPLLHMSLAETYRLVHGVDERIRIDDLGTGACFLADLTVAMLGG